VAFRESFTENFLQNLDGRKSMFWIGKCGDFLQRVRIAFIAMRCNIHGRSVYGQEKV